MKPLQEVKQAEEQVETLLKKERSKGLPVYVGDIESMLENVSMQVPIATGEMVYNMEVDNQERVYTVMLAIGMMALILGVLLIVL